MKNQKLYCLFDTSAINNLLRDENKEIIIDKIKKNYIVFSSSLNVAEVIANKNSNERTEILNLLSALTENKHPLDLPSQFVKKQIAAFRNGQNEFVGTIGKKSQNLLEAIKNPESITDEEVDEAKTNLENIKGEFKKLHEKPRPKFQSFLKKSTESNNFNNFVDWYKQYVDEKKAFEQGGIIRHYCRSFLESEINAQEAKRVYDNCSALRGYFFYWIYPLYKHSIASENHGLKEGKYAGSIDLIFSVYLGSISKFVTSDNPQYEALRTINTNSAQNCQIVKYKNFLNEKWN